MKSILFAASFFLATPVLAIDISEAMLNKFVEQKLAENANRDIRVLDPKVALRDGYASICAKVRAKAFPNDVAFCADMTPKWRQETGSLLATRMALVSLNAPGVNEKDIELVKLIVNQIVLPGLEGIEVYRTDELIGKQISGLKVLPGRLDISL